MTAIWTKTIKSRKTGSIYTEVWYGAIKVNVYEGAANENETRRIILLHVEGGQLTAEALTAEIA